MNIPTWMTTARAAIGTREIPGHTSNPLILRWAAKVGKWLGMSYNDDDVPWCGLFAAYCMIENGFIPPSIAVRASSWADWGIPLSKPSPGAVLVFTREGGGHVGFYVSEDAQNFHVLGGNQSNSVCLTRIAKNRCAAIRWPAAYGLPTVGPVVAQFTGVISTNEA